MWTKETEATLKAMKQAGHSYAEIGKAIGKSKSAVAGMVYRLGLSQTRVEVKVQNTKARYYAPVKNNYNRPIEVYTAYGNPVTLGDCVGCRFPIDGTKLYCNAEILANDYCPDHRRICYMKAKK